MQNCCLQEAICIVKFGTKESKVYEVYESSPWLLLFYVILLSED